MPSSPLDEKHGRMTSGMTCHHRHWTAHTIERRRGWHAIIAFGKHIRLNDIGCGMPLSPLGSTNDRTTSGVTCHHRLWTAHTVERRRAFHYRLWAAHTVERRLAWHAIIAFGLADTVEWHRAWHAIIALGRETRSNDIECGMPSTPWDSIHGRTTSGVACYHRHWAAQTVGRRRAWHAITALGQHTRSDDVWRVTTSPPSNSTQGRTTWGVA